MALSQEISFYLSYNLVVFFFFQFDDHIDNTFEGRVGGEGVWENSLHNDPQPQI